VARRIPAELEVEVRRIPHLAKNERDMGHPASVSRTEKEMKKLLDRANEVLTQTLKPSVLHLIVSARLKSCPDTKQSFSTEF
jgi:hypothetical protein